MNRMQGKTVIVSGCAGGIGGAVVRRLANEGASLVLADLNTGFIKELADELETQGVPVLAVAVDLAEEESVVALYAKVLERFHTFHALHNNAADTRLSLMDRDMAVADMDAEVWDASFRVTARGTMLMIKHALPILVKAGGGAIINTSSGASLLGDIFYPAYAAAKSAVNSLTKYVAAQYGKDGIRCNAVSPGLIVSQAAAHNVGSRFEMFERHTLMPNLGEPNDIAAVVAMLASDDGKFITSQIIAVDGGITSHFPHVADAMPTYKAAVKEMSSKAP